MSLESQVLVFMLVLFRCAAFLAFAPVIGGQQIPRLVKVGFSLSLAWLWIGEALVGSGPAAALANELAAGGNGHLDVLSLGLAVMREVGLGAAVGYLLSLMMTPARIAGVYLGHEAGLQMATLVDPNSNTSGNVMSELFDVIGTMLFFVFNIHHHLLHALHGLMQVWPVGGALPKVNMEFVAHQVSRAHQAGLLAALPAAGCLFITMCGLMVLMRSTPTFTLFSVGQSLRVGVGLVATLVFLPHVMAVFLRAFEDVLGLLGN